MRLAATILILLVTFSLIGQSPTIERIVNGDNSVSLVANNPSYAPATFILEVKLNNMMASTDLSQPIVIAAGKTNVLISNISRVKNARYGMNYEYRYILGDAVHTSHDNHYEYLVPHQGNYPITQGYNGSLSHQGQYALDWAMAEGTTVIAARPGVVIEVAGNSNSGCANPSCSKDANYIKVLHNDGSIASYLHLKHYGLLVQPGTKVNRGQAIGLSGNTGFSTAPHLHFEVAIPTLAGPKTIPTRFVTGEGRSITF